MTGADESDAAVMSLQSSGAPDPGFGTSGKVTFSPGWGRDIVVDGNGNI